MQSQPCTLSALGRCRTRSGRKAGYHCHGVLLSLTFTPTHLTLSQYKEAPLRSPRLTAPTPRDTAPCSRCRGFVHTSGHAARDVTVFFGLSETGLFRPSAFLLELCSTPTRMLYQRHRHRGFDFNTDMAFTPGFGADGMVKGVCAGSKEVQWEVLRQSLN